MTTHEPTIIRIQDNPCELPRLEVRWHNGEPEEGDTVLMSVEMFKQSIAVLNDGRCVHGLPKPPPAGGCDGSCAEPKCRNGMPLLTKDPG